MVRAVRACLQEELCRMEMMYRLGGRKAGSRQQAGRQAGKAGRPTEGQKQNKMPPTRATE